MTAIVTRTHWYHPEWSAVALAAGGWLGMLAVATTEPALLFGHHEMHTPAEALTHSTTMTAAMMAPLVLDQVNHIATFSLWRRRYRAVGAFLLGYLGVWTLIGAAMMTGGAAWAELVGWRVTIVVAFAIAVAATLSRGRPRRLRQCWETRPLALTGWRADRDCTAAGLRAANRCVAVCWALMLAVTIDHGLVAMAGATAITLAERRGRRNSGRRFSAAVAALGAIALLLTFVIPGGGHEMHDMH